jgi:hypothetical protein
MRHNFVLILFLTFASNTSLLTQTADPPPPQTARQALIEMFLGKGPDDFAKHLPDDARRTLIHKGDSSATSWVLRIAEIGHQITAQSEHLETFDLGPNLLVSQPRGGNEKIEIAVERDSLMGESEEIELSVHYYKDGQLVPLPVVPRLTFTMQQEKEIWRLAEVTAAAHVPLTDPDYLASLRKQQNEQNETMAQMRVNVIVGAETRFASKNQNRGYTCTLANLFANAAENSEDGGNFYDPGQTNEEWNGYRFQLSGCQDNPATKFRITAVPIDADSEMKTFCADQSRTVKFIVDGKPSTCFSDGQPLNQGSTAEVIE